MVYLQHAPGSRAGAMPASPRPRGTDMEAGEQITSNLRLVRQLGKGGMGSVWVADHLTLGTQVAVKFMWRTFAEHPQFLERFRREATAAAQLRNPHVTQVFDHGVTATGEPYIVMEFLEGEDLGKRVKRQGPLPAALVADILSQAAKALGKAHQSGLVHRDIKADNIFLVDLDGDAFVKVLDFGIVKLGGEPSVSMTSTGGTFGTPLYMSPEQLLSAKHVDHRADLWSLGVVAYYSLTAAVPFQGDTIGAISVAVHTGVFQPVTAHRPDLPPALDTWFQRVFRKNPDERFHSARELADAFHLAAVGEAPADGRLSAPAWPAPAAPLGTRPLPNTPTPLPGAAPAPLARSAAGAALLAGAASGPQLFAPGPQTPPYVAAPDPRPFAPGPQTPPYIAPPGGSGTVGVGGTGDASGRTLGGKAVTIGGKPEKRGPVIAAAAGGVLVVGVLGALALTRPWEPSEGAGAAVGEGTAGASNALVEHSGTPEPPPVASSASAAAGAQEPEAPAPSASTAGAAEPPPAPKPSTTADAGAATAPGTAKAPASATPIAKGQGRPQSTAPAKPASTKPPTTGEDPGF